MKYQGVLKHHHNPAYIRAVGIARNISTFQHNPLLREYSYTFIDGNKSISYLLLLLLL